MPDSHLFVIGLNLGPEADPTTMAVLKQMPAVGDDGTPARDDRGRAIHHYVCGHLVRYPVGIGYPAIAVEVARLIGAPKVQAPGRPRLAINATGIGRAPVDLFLAAGLDAEISPITITAAPSASRVPWKQTGTTSFKVPRAELVSTLQAGLETGLLKIVPTMDLAGALKVELSSLVRRVTSSGNVMFNAHPGDRHDLVFAVALALWLGEIAGPCPQAG